MQTTISTTNDPLRPLAEPPSMGHMARPHHHAWLVLLSIGPILLLILRLVPALDQARFHNALSHVLISGDASLLGSALAVLVLRTAYRARDGRAFLVGMGFLSTATMFMIHYRLSTPGLLLGGSEIAAAWTPMLSLALGSLFFGLSGVHLSARVNHWLMRYAGVGLVLYLIFWLCYSWAFLVVVPAQVAREAALARPTIAGSGPFTLATARTALAMIGLGCCTFAIWRHCGWYRRSPSPAGLAITCGIALFGEALLTQQFAQLYAPSFWLYHIEEAAGFTVISYAILGAYQRGYTDESLLERLFLPGTRARIHADYAMAVNELLTSLACAALPTSTLRHTLQRRFGLSESQIEVIEQAAAAVAQERQQRQELERLNATLRRVEQDKAQLTQMVVHDLKNPLSAQVGFLELLQHEPLTEYQRILLENVLRSSKNLAGLISDLLDIARLEGEGIELDRGLYSPRDLLHECACEISGWLTQEGKTIEVNVPGDVPLLFVDLRLMRRVLLNLVSNAIKHTPAGTQVTLRANRADAATIPTERVIIEVIDNGQGMPPERLDRIFEKFTQFGGSRRANQDNTGLGLFFCRLAVEAQDGSISVASCVGEGTTFRLELPGI